MLFLGTGIAAALISSSGASQECLGIAGSGMSSLCLATSTKSVCQPGLQSLHPAFPLLQAHSRISKLICQTSAPSTLSPSKECALLYQLQVARWFGPLCISSHSPSSYSAVAASLWEALRGGTTCSEEIVNTAESPRRKD